MLLKYLDQKIRRAFSSAASQYDALTSLHREIGRELVRKIDSENPEPNILDVGMGTGWLSARLRHFFPGALVVGIDPAEGMVNMALERDKEDPLKIVQADARALPFRNGQFDVVTSNLAYQWVEELDLAFTGLSKILRPKGHVCFTMFGFNSLSELFEALEAAKPEGAAVSGNSFRRLAQAHAVEIALRNAGFEDVSVTAERIHVHFPDMLAILKWTRDIGANNLANDLFVGKNLLARAGEYYDRRFRDGFGVQATFEVLWVSARKPA